MNLLDSAASGCAGCLDLLRLTCTIFLIADTTRLKGGACPNGHEFSEDDLKEALRRLE